MISSNFLASLQRYMTFKGYTVFNGRLNIAVLEGCNPDGTVNNNEPDRFNDMMLVWDSLNDTPRLLYSGVCTSEPGRYYTMNPMNPAGAARIAFGQFTAWQFGFHQWRKDHPALVQVRPIPVHRDANKDFKRTGDNVQVGLFGINIHDGRDTPVGGSIGRHSAGCIVTPSVAQFTRFLDVLRNSNEFKVNPKHIWTVTIIDNKEFRDWRENR